jgi:hypothetical protein
MAISGAAALAALVLASGGSRLQASFAAGAGFDSNLDHRVSGATGAAFASSRAALGGLARLGPSTSVHGGVRVDGERFLDLAQLSGASVGVTASVLQGLGRWASVAVAPHAARSWTGDPGRDATLFGARAMLQLMPDDRVTLAGWVEASRRAAAEDVYSADRQRVGGSVELRMGARSYLSLGYANERGDEVFYRDTEGGDLGGMGGPMIGFFGSSQKAESAYATSHAVTPALELAFGERSALEVSHRLAFVSGPYGDFRKSSTYVGLLFRR